MKAAPGSHLAVDDIFGRDLFISSVWSILERNSIRMEAERRIGKTCILQKMAAERPAGWDTLMLDVEEVHSISEFAEKLCEKVHQHLTGWKKEGRRFRDLLGLIGGTQIGPLKFPEKKSQPAGYWKKLLTSAVEDLVEQQAGVGKRVVFLMDEMPWMLSAIAKADGQQTAMELLDVLRGLRQSSTTGQGFRIVLCGSIGLHHILAELRHAGYRNEPVNDMMLIEVPPLAPDVAKDLAARLIAGENLPGDVDAASRIAELTGGVPYYIHWVVSILSRNGRPAIHTEIDEAVEWLLTAPQDPCDFRHFLKRIPSYYSVDGKIVLALLDHAAKSQTPLSQADLINIGKSTAVIEDDQVREVVRDLTIDHYLSKETDGRYTFRSTLLRRWWLLERGLN